MSLEQTLVRFKEIFDIINRDGPFEMVQLHTLERSLLSQLFFGKKYEINHFGYISNTVDETGNHQLLLTNCKDGHNITGATYPAYLFEFNKDGELQMVYQSAITFHIVWKRGTIFENRQKYLDEALKMFERIAKCAPFVE